MTINLRPPGVTRPPLTLVLVPFQKFPIDFKIFQWKCPLQNKMALPFQRRKSRPAMYIWLCNMISYCECIITLHSQPSYSLSTKYPPLWFWIIDKLHRPSKWLCGECFITLHSQPSYCLTTKCECIITLHSQPSYCLTTKCDCIITLHSQPSYCLTTKCDCIITLQSTLLLSDH